MTETPDPADELNQELHSIEDNVEWLKKQEADLAFQSDAASEVVSSRVVSPPEYRELQFLTEDYGIDYGIVMAHDPPICVFIAKHGRARYSFHVPKANVDLFLNIDTDEHSANDTEEAIKDPGNLKRLHERIQRWFNHAPNAKRFNNIPDLQAIL